MMRRLLSNIRILFIVWAVVAVLLLIVIIFILRPTLHTLIPDQALREQAIAALIGSIFGALLGSAATTAGIVITDHLRDKRTRDHERRVKHYNSIVKLQRQMNVIRASLEDNTAALKSVIEANNIGLPTFQRPIQVLTDEAPFENLYDIKLINMLNDLYYDLRRVNLDATNLTRAQDTLAEHLFTSKITSASYKLEVGIFNPHVVQLRQHILYMLDHIVLDICAYVRICADNDASDEMKDRQARMLKGRKKITNAQIRKTRENISEELEQSEIEGLTRQEEESTYE